MGFCILQHSFFTRMGLLIERKQQVKVGSKKFTRTMIHTEKIMAFDSFFYLVIEGGHGLIQQKELFFDDVFFEFLRVGNLVGSLKRSILCNMQVV